MDVDEAIKKFINSCKKTDVLRAVTLLTAGDADFKHVTVTEIDAAKVEVRELPDKGRID